ncbi:MAG: carboxymuconolactone decarboxylase family protein [Candidatus Binatia bacterium]|nr:carboxymuconolactone decarboxylase family protein [bacterium]MDG1399705.1 carboxymuconolactone decarboxylase family protein [Candidatus Binatia bacterium]MDG1959639.1 carboxymuconolactone decarboxylase family protein [Candidatus Binatia bacterium]MDG2010300.1 carboxymuconolactone decarboxylase family protein [Candidatus Binatia bacterium]HAC81221.1 carboxymuconolactone decarboxylase [Deltaproteobacteria bacterium]
MSETKREKGLRLMEDVCGIAIDPGNTSRFLELTVDNLFADVWGNESLAIRDRRLVVLGILAAMGDGSNLGVHMTQALSRGDLSPEELEEIPVQVAHYAGWPRATTALGAAAQAIATHREKSDEAE